MKAILFIFLSALTLFAEGAAQTYQGVITDTMCGAKHAMMKDTPDAKCVKICAKGSSEYALFDGKQVWKLTNQKLASKFPGQKVTVSGSADPSENKIKVASIEAAQ